jgi:hypothetical protein
MTLLQRLFADPQIKPYYLEVDELKELREEFENYLFLIYEKTNIIVLILNKYYDINYKEKGYIDDEVKRKKLIEKNKLYKYYLGWTNRRLKRIMKIFKLELKSKVGLIKQERDIIKCINDLKKYFEEKGIYESIESLQKIHRDFRELEKIIRAQKKELDTIYPLKEWSEEKHKDIFSKDFLKNLKKEIEIIFDSNNITNNYNYYPALISEGMHKHKIPDETILRKLIDNTIEKIKEKRKEKKIRTIKCYHARPIHVTKPLFPIGISNSGFFVDKNLNETVNFIKKFYRLRNDQIEVYELEIPLNLFKLSMPDPFDPEPLKTTLDHSYLFKPTVIPKINEYFKKGILKSKRVRKF